MLDINNKKTITESDLQKTLAQLQARVEELEADHIWLSFLSQISWTLTSTFSLKEILSQLVFFTAELLRTEICVLRLLEGDELVLGAQVGIPQDMVFERLPANEGIAGYVTREKQPLRINDIKTHPITREYYFRHGARFDFSSFLGAPLVVRDTLIGIIGVYTKEPRQFTDTELEHLVVVANHAAIAIENARTFESMQQTKQDWVETFDAIPDEVFITDTNYTIRRANRAFADKLGLPFHQIIGKKCYEIVERMNRPPEYCQQHKMMLLKEPVTNEFDDIQRGETLQINIIPIKNDRNEITGAVHINRDITKWKQMQQQLIQSEKLAALGQLMSGVAHELNNPLTGVFGYAELLMRKELDPSVKPAIEKIYRESQRAVKIIQNLLGFARPYKPEKIYTHIHQVLEDTLALREYELRVNRITIERDYTPHLPKTMLDPHQMQQVFLNIIMNAESALSQLPITVERKLTISTKFAVSEENRLRIEFIDNGPGIAPEHLSKIFDPFFTTKEAGHGTGLGLSIAYGIIQEHQGTIFAQSEPGHGAKFIIELPILEENGIPKPRLTLTRSEKDISQQQPKKILVIDDEESIGMFLQEALRDEQHQVDIATNGSDALRKIIATEYDIVLSDIKMPGLDGETLYQQIKQVKPELVTQLVFMTGDIINPQTKQFLAQTQAAFLEKPFTIQMVREVIRRILAGR
ncbi:MAG: ATP-binding protein [bacterium]|nr:ATP-binding protein [bacterium]